LGNKESCQSFSLRFVFVRNKIKKRCDDAVANTNFNHIEKKTDTAAATTTPIK